MTKEENGQLVIDKCNFLCQEYRCIFSSQEIEDIVAQIVFNVYGRFGKFNSESDFNKALDNLTKLYARIEMRKALESLSKQRILESIDKLAGDNKQDWILKRLENLIDRNFFK
jgi:hypothetical protein